jgi:transcription elongation factor Elf1
LHIWGISFCVLSKVVSLILISGKVCERGIPVEMETVDKVVDIDNNFMDPQFCATIACDIYKHLRVSEVQHSFPYCIE